MKSTQHSIRDELRFTSAVQATQLAMDKWASLGFGRDALTDRRLRMDARMYHRLLARALRIASRGN